MNYTAKKNTAIATGSADYAIILQNIYDEQMKNPAKFLAQITGGRR